MLELLSGLKDKIFWFCISCAVCFLVYFSVLIYGKRQNFKRLGQEFGFRVPDIPNVIYGHLDQFALREYEWNWHKQFGKVYGFYSSDMPQIRVADLDLINEIFLKQNKLFNARIWTEYRVLIVAKSILFNRGQRWKNSRRLIQPAMAAYRIKKNDTASNMTDIHHGIKCLVEQFKRMSTKVSPCATKDMEVDFKQFKRLGYAPVPHQTSPTSLSIETNIYDLMQVVSLDIIFRLGFNLDNVDVLKGSDEPSIKMVRGWLNLVASPINRLAYAIPLLRLIMIPYLLLFNKSFRNYQIFMRSLLSGDLTKMPEELNMSETRMDEGRKVSTEPKRIYHVLLEEYQLGRMSGSETIAHMMAVLVAGFETTATTSSYIFWCLAKYAKLQEEVRADIERHGIESRRLDMFIKEVMRMYPALPNFVIRSPSEDTKVAGYRVNRGVPVYLSVQTVHYDETIWQDPHRFDPSRFAEGKTYPPGVYVPFGLGHRMCAGYQLAMREMKTFVCELLASFRVELIAPHELTTESSTIFLTRPKNEICLRFVPLAVGTDVAANEGGKSYVTIGRDKADNLWLEEEAETD